MAYSDADRARALAALARAGGDAKKVAQETGIGERTIWRWSTDAKNGSKKGIESALEVALEYLLNHVPKMTGRDWGVAVGILFDKFLLMRGDPTSRAESIVKGLNGLPDSQRSAVLEAAERILVEATGGGVASDDAEHDA